MAQFKITGKQAIESAEGLRRLAATGQDGKLLYKFDPKTRVVLAKRQKKMAEIVELLDEQRKQLLVEHEITGLSDEKGQPKDAPANIKAFNEAYEAMLKAEHELECGTISESSLDLAKNDIPHTILAVLDWMIVWAGDEEKPALKAAAAG